MAPYLRLKEITLGAPIKSYDISFVRHPDGTCIVTHRHLHGEWWCEWVVADSEELAYFYSRRPYYQCPGMSYAHTPYRVAHPKKFVLYQRGGLDI